MIFEVNVNLYAISILYCLLEFSRKSLDKFNIVYNKTYIVSILENYKHKSFLMV